MRLNKNLLHGRTKSLRRRTRAEDNVTVTSLESQTMTSSSSGSSVTENAEMMSSVRPHLQRSMSVRTSYKKIKMNKMKIEKVSFYVLNFFQFRKVNSFLSYYKYSVKKYGINLL